MTALQPRWPGRQTELTAPRTRIPVNNFRSDVKLRWGMKFWPLSQDWVYSASLVDNEVFRKRVPPASYNQRRPHDSLLLSIFFCRTYGILLIHQHLPAWRLQPQTLVAWKLLTALEVSKNLPVSQRIQVLTTNTAIKMAGLCLNICWPCYQKLTNVDCPPRRLHLKSVWTAFFAEALPRHSHRRLCCCCLHIEKQHVTVVGPPAPNII